MSDELCRSLARENPLLARPCYTIDEVPQTSKCDECYAWADATLHKVKEHESYVICSRACDDYDDLCWLKCEEKLDRDEKFLLKVLEEVYYVIAPEEKPECIDCLRSWNPGREHG